ncbi:Uncharacterized protein PCOAH_00052290 [Plasmodium coatneyi]|uniref:KIR protein n=1 Tax=Plasmodium coatneyi TaxID=208452 RepID=A0A1B1E7T5_9APIC|nr:Uncharacterized protein PCOAH_00052290 [Plasmodium coatneyi]ANQ11065.1 Uncharacterized protein PCOAH_00052290 [Plasmodium coatneyi]
MVNVGADVTLTEDACLQNLTSRTNYYDKFDGGSGSCTCTEGSKGQVRSVLKGISEVNKCADEIVNGACCLSKQNSYPWPGSKECDFLYFWVGDILLSKCSVKSLETFLGKVFDELKNWTELRCYDYNYNRNISEDLFRKRKKIFDYSLDYGDIQLCSLKTGSPCAGECCQYLEQISSIYEDIKGDCGGNYRTEPYCTHFTTVFSNDSNSPGTLKLKCPGGLRAESDSSRMVVGTRYSPEGHEDSAVSSHTSDTTSNGGGTGVPAAVSAAGGLAAIALPTLTYLLYKVSKVTNIIELYIYYTSLFSGIKNTFFGGSSNLSGNRRKRSTKHDFDTLTEDDTLTEYGTAPSTVDSTADSTDGSTVYGGRPATGRANNNRRGKHRNISYQHM